VGDDARGGVGDMVGFQPRRRVRPWRRLGISPASAPELPAGALEANPTPPHQKTDVHKESVRNAGGPYDVVRLPTFNGLPR
jgi:hypothetical protein